MMRTLLVVVASMLSAACVFGADAATGVNDPARTVRMATFNIKELSREKIDAVNDQGRGVHPQLRKAAEVIQRVRPDILLINEIDFDEAGRENARLFQERYLRVSRNGQRPVEYEHIVFEPVNTGVPAGRDFNHNDHLGDPEDAYGFGRYPGQYGMALYSRFPVQRENVRTFRLLLWKDMPGNLMPDGRDGRPAWYDEGDRDVFRLSSKSHWDVPVRIGDETVHLLASHPTPPVFDGPEDRNGRRNFDEIRLWADYIAGGERAGYIRDDRGRAGPLAADARFIVLGDLNAEPAKGEAINGVKAIDQLLNLPEIQDTRPRRRDDPAILRHPPSTEDVPHQATHTSDFGRLDYVLPGRGLKVIDAGVYHPAKDRPGYELTTASDHFLVWVDVELTGNRPGE